MVRKAQLLEDATDLTDRIKGRMVKKEQTSGAPSKSNNGKKRPLSITDGPSQEQKPKVFTPTALNKPRCKHCDKLGHTAEECWRKRLVRREEPYLEKRQNPFSGLEPPSEVATARPVAISEGVATRETAAFWTRWVDSSRLSPVQPSGRFSRTRPDRVSRPEHDGHPRESNGDYHTHEEGTEEDAQE
ncbi:hypothetical protein Taro_020192 [Colocasia esculenta]|uniref:Uncharacterized protein n=1 Tax=Colocasia esculenta TaxID=4460 RepID=A0A843UVL5_COLES|nr:hypothetical protein [Colocasia esculenta]